MTDTGNLSKFALLEIYDSNDGSIQFEVRSSMALGLRFMDKEDYSMENPHFFTGELRNTHFKHICPTRSSAFTTSYLFFQLLLLLFVHITLAGRCCLCEPHHAYLLYIFVPVLFWPFRLPSILLPSIPASSYGSNLLKVIGRCTQKIG